MKLLTPLDVARERMDEDIIINWNPAGTKSFHSIMFVHSCIKIAADTQGLIPVIHMCPDGYRPQPGDIFSMDLPGEQGHSGFVDKIVDDDYIYTVEVCRTEHRGIENYAVYPNQRKISEISCFGRIYFEIKPADR